MPITEIGKIRYTTDHLYWEISQLSVLQQNSSRIWSPTFCYIGEKKNTCQSTPAWCQNFYNDTWVKVSITNSSNYPGNFNRVRVGVMDDKSKLINLCDCVWNTSSFVGLSLMKKSELTEKGKTAGYLRLFLEIPKETFNLDAATQTKAENDSGKLQQDLKALLASNKDSDLTIKVQEREFNVHRGILRVRSSVFDSMLSHGMTESKEGVIKVDDCAPDVFEVFLHFVYSGETENINPGNACDLYYIADKYNIQHLKKISVDFLKETFSTENICESICLATKHNERNFLNSAIDYLAKNLEEILTTCSWLQFMKDNPVEANEIYIKSLKLGYAKKG